MAKRSRTRPTLPASSATPPVGSRRSSPARRSTPRRGYQKTFVERYGSWLLGGVVIAGVLLIGFVALTSASQPAYACESQLTPGPTEPNPTPFPPTPTPAPSESAGASPSESAAASAPASSSPQATASPTASPSLAESASPGGSPSASQTEVPEPTARLGFTTTDLGRAHVTGTVKYAFCPPTGGDHYNIAGQAPMQPDVYGPSTDRSPQYWVHNLEHGYVVLAYRCPSGVLGQGDCISQQDMTAITAWYNNAPPPPRTTCAKKVIAVRFDSMDTRFALLAWDRALLMDQFNADQAALFAAQWEDAFTTPEEGPC